MRIGIFAKPLFGLSSFEIISILTEHIRASVAGVELLDVVDVAGLANPQLIDCQRIPDNISAQQLRSRFTDFTYASNQLEIFSGKTALLSQATASISVSGLTGLAAHYGFAGGWTRAEIVAIDQLAKHWLEQLGITDAPGFGAGLGDAALVAKAGGIVIPTLNWLVESQRADQLLAQAELAIVLTDRFDFGYHGGAVVEWALANATIPVVVAAPGAEMSRREARNIGVEEVWNIGDTNASGASAVTQLAGFASSLNRSWV